MLFSERPGLPRFAFCIPLVPIFRKNSRILGKNVVSSAVSKVALGFVVLYVAVNFSLFTGSTTGQGGLLEYARFIAIKVLQENSAQFPIEFQFSLQHRNIPAFYAK